MTLRTIIIQAALLLTVVTAQAQRTNNNGPFVRGIYQNRVNPDDPVRQAKPGILIIGTGENIRVVSAFSGNSKGGMAYTNAVNNYRKRLGDTIRIYSMVIPIASQYYTPLSAQNLSVDEKSTLDGMYARLVDVKGIDVYTPLGMHADEHIYLRTDHHWAPLGAYYAAEAFAKEAGVPFHDLSWYDKKTIHNFLGTMYSVYTKDPEVGKAPEDFDYYVPRNVKYTTTAITYRLGKKRQTVGQNAPKEVSFFRNYGDGNGAAYCTFMGGDANTTKVVTSTKNGRKLMIIKDSYGNAIPGYLFYSFEEIHVLDFRYFPNNVITYVKENGITDILFAHCISLAYAQATGVGLQKMLDR